MTESPKIYRDKKEQHKIENIMGIYITGQMMKNYASCLSKIYDGPDKNSRYVNNKMRELIKNADKALQPIQKFLKQTEGEEAVDDMLILYHDVIDHIYGMNEQDIKRIMGLINKMKKVS